MLRSEIIPGARVKCVFIRGGHTGTIESVSSNDRYTITWDDGNSDLQYREWTRPESFELIALPNKSKQEQIKEKYPCSVCGCYKFETECCWFCLK